LYNMVRIMVGTLMETGLGSMGPESVEDIIKSLDRNKAGKTVPAHGLYLVEVYY
jgi:tRNA pseudouridine38-40 synthase